jgi:cobalt-zinc-cadmium efflux system membrane fusion protein
MQFLKYIFPLLTSLMLVACASETPSGEDPVAAQTEVSPVHDSPMLTMTPEQQALAGLETGKVQKVDMGGEVECTGVVEAPPQYMASVYTPVPGFVRELKYLPGSYVQKGTLLASIEHPEIIRMQREFLETQSQLAYLESDVARKDTLAREKAASRRDLEKAQADLQLQQARYKGLKAELKLIGIDVQQLESSGTIQQRMALYAPVSGHITKVHGHIGMLVTPDAPVYEMVDASHSHVELEVYAKDLPYLKEDQLVLCQVPGEATIYRAEVHLLGKMIDPETRTLRVHGHFEKEPTPLLPGTFVQAKIQLGGKTVSAVPETAVVQEGAEQFVFLFDGEHFSREKIDTGLKQDGLVELVGWTYPAEQQIVTKGAYYLNGMEGEAPDHSH